MGGHLHGLRHAHHQVGLRNHPALRPEARRRRIMCVAARALRHLPRPESVAISCGRKRRVIGKMPEAGVGKPRRHLALARGFLNRARIRAAPGDRSQAAWERFRRGDGKPGNAVGGWAAHHDKTLEAFPPASSAHPTSGWLLRSRSVKAVMPSWRSPKASTSNPRIKIRCQSRSRPFGSLRAGSEVCRYSIFHEPHKNLIGKQGQV